MDIHAFTANGCLQEMLTAVKTFGVAENSRAGKVMTIPFPVILHHHDPQDRVVLDRIRDCNPFFHVMEFVWMMAGDNTVDFPLFFNKRFNEYADNGVVNGAYGYRWRNHFFIDQITTVARVLRQEPTTRQAVLGMWDPNVDLGKPHKDRPCNTHIYFRTEGHLLNMLVCNRSNDIVWGMCGANLVHMTMLHELIATAAGLKLGDYRVISNNAHIYERHFSLLDRNVDKRNVPNTIPLLSNGESIQEFLLDAEDLIKGAIWNDTRTDWFDKVAWPMYDVYLNRKNGLPFNTDNIEDPAWRLAAQEWIARRLKSTDGVVGSPDITQS